MRYAIFDENGFALGFYTSEFNGDRLRPIYGEAPKPTEENPDPLAPIIGEEPNPDCSIPAEAVEITEGQWMELLSFPSNRKWLNGQVVEHTPPPPPPPVIEVPSVTLWERLTEEESEQVDAAMAAQSFRTRQIFLTANTFRSDHELWPLLVQMTTELFGEARATKLLDLPSIL